MVSTDVVKAVSMIGPTREQGQYTVQCDGVWAQGQWGRRRGEGGDEGRECRGAGPVGPVSHW